MDDIALIEYARRFLMDLAQLFQAIDGKYIGYIAFLIYCLCETKVFLTFLLTR